MLLLSVCASAMAATASPVDASDVSRIVEVRKGEVTLVHVWATWCGPCKEVFEPLNRTTAAGAPRGLSVLAFAVDDSKAPVDRYLRDRRTSWRDYYVRGTEAELIAELGGMGGSYSGAVPYDLLLAADGTVLDEWAGGLDGPDLERRIFQYLPEGAVAGPPTTLEVAAVQQGPVRLLCAGREGDKVYVDGWNAGVLPLDTELVSGPHEFRIEGEQGRVVTKRVVDFSQGTATIDLGSE